MRVLLTLLLLAALAGASVADEARPATDAAAPEKMLGFLPYPDSYAFRVMNGHAFEKSVESVAFGPRATFDVLGFLPEIAGHRIRLGVELLGMIHDKKGVKHELNFNPLLFDWRYDEGGSFVPYAEFGWGGLWTTLRFISIGGKWQFANHVGVGFHWFTTPEIAVSLGYRFRHISNAGLAGNGGENQLNHGLNENYLILGLTRFPGRDETRPTP